MTIFFTSDTHFGHKGAISMCARPFSCIEEMEEVMVQRWNERVGKTDEVWHLGDFAYKLDAEGTRRVFDRLRGRRHLVIGNHDPLKTRSLPWHSPPVVRMMLRHPDEKLPIVLDHYAMRTWPKSHYGSIHLFGHSHGNLPPHGRSIDIGVDCWDFRPVTLDEIKAKLPEHVAHLRQAADIESEPASSAVDA